MCEKFTENILEIVTTVYLHKHRQTLQRKSRNCSRKAGKLGTKLKYSVRQTGTQMDHTQHIASPMQP